MARLDIKLTIFAKGVLQMWSIFIIAFIFILVFVVSRKNYVNRTKYLSDNFNAFNELLKERYDKLSDQQKKIFISSLEKDLYLFFDNEILKTPSKMPRSTWTIQQKIMKQQEIASRLKKFIKSLQVF
ncbi:hypothetical protein [Haloimpatiens massiliensis]|uniref:hypothetical protein n=1 Tax=Haloimpatiens massiliensis TaxID=1658110 RepID=UPI0011AEE9B0|nr:hypothetical protein [Haloimpatiens massiliensis]